MSLRQEISQLCQASGLRLNTDLGQHFLVDETVLDAILDASLLQAGERVIEIGPGLGVLTRRLLTAGGQVTAIEIDRRFLPVLAMATSQGGNVHPSLTIIEGNALEVPFPAEPYRIIANIPYHITSPLLRHAFLESATRPLSLTLLIQREVAERICDTEDRGLLTIVVGLFGTPRIVTHVPPTAFLPAPKVDSSVIHIDAHAQPLITAEDLPHVLRVLKVGFHQKRKMLRNTISTLPGGEEALSIAEIDPQRRPQTLSVEEWVRLGLTFRDAPAA
jgi:16S rRNA (adenine1518-N6/adenine1519-N6)-dimethyltransferase